MPMSVRQLEPGQGRVRLTLVSEQGEHKSLSAALVVVADGAESPLRHALGIDTRTVDYHQSAIIANVSFTQSHQGVAYERFTGERSEEHTSELQSRGHLVCRLLLEK